MTPTLTVAQLKDVPTEAEFRERIVGDESAFGLGNLGLAEVPPYLDKFTEIRYLTLGNNRLTELPDSFSQLQGLRHIQLTANEFTVFPEVLLQLDSLQQIEFGKNHLTSLPCEAFAGTQIRHVSVPGNPISREEWKRCERIAPGVVELYPMPVE